MPANACGRWNVSPRCQFLIDSLAPGKSRTGRPLLPLQIHLRETRKMLEHGISGAQRPGGGMLASWELTVHASELIPGSVTFRGTGN